MKFLHIKPRVLFVTIALAKFFLASSASSSVFAGTSSGVAVKDMQSGVPVTLGEFIAAAKVRGEVIPVQNTARKNVFSNEPALSVADLTEKKLLDFADLIELTSHPDRQPSLHQPALLPSTLVTLSEAAMAVPELSAAKSKPEFEIPVKIDVLTISIIQDGNSYMISPERLALGSIGSEVAVSVQGKMPGDLALFVRDSHIAEFSKVGLSITAKSAGATELYVVAGGKMNIVPLVVKETAKPFELKVPETLLSLDGIVHGGSASALYPGIEKNTGLQKLPEEQAQESEAEIPANIDIAGIDDQYSPSESSFFYNEKASAEYQGLKIKVVDDRTPLDSKTEGRSYPAPSVEVRVIGTNYLTRTDATGVAMINEMPKSARMLVKITDPLGVYRPTVSEVSAAKSTQTIRLMRNFSFEGFSEIVHASQHAALGSFCLRITDAKTRAAVSGYHLEIDARGEGPYYFNPYGFIDRSVGQTGDDGRVCAFNVDPGPVAITIYEGEALVATFTKSIFSGYHLEDSVAVGDEGIIQVKLASLAPAAVQLNADTATANRYLPVEYADVIPFGHANSMTFLDFGRVESREAVSYFDGRIRLAVQTADFEPSIYSVPARYQQVPVIPLVPRGFIEDMAVYAQVTYEPTLGTVFVEYNHHESIRDESVSIRLVDHDNNSRGEGWYFSDRPLTKALFFNVPAGIYQVQADTADGYWITSQVIYVYDENMTYIRLGGPIRIQR